MNDKGLGTTQLVKMHHYLPQLQQKNIIHISIKENCLCTGMMLSVSKLNNTVNYGAQ